MAPMAMARKKKFLQRRGRPVCLPQSGNCAAAGQTHRSAPTLGHGIFTGGNIFLEMGFLAARSRLYGRAAMIAGLEADGAATPLNF
jgi:hypothetical protein